MYVNWSFALEKKDTKEQVQCKATTKLYLFKTCAKLSVWLCTCWSKQDNIFVIGKILHRFIWKKQEHISCFGYMEYISEIYQGFMMIYVFHQQIPSQTDFPPYQSPAGRHPLPPSLAQKLQPLRLQLRLVEYVAPWNKGHDGICTYLSPGIAYCLTFDPWCTCDLPQYWTLSSKLARRPLNC